MPRIPGISYRRAVRALQRAGFWVIPGKKHEAMTNGTVVVTIPRHNPIDAFTMGGIVVDAGLTVEKFRRLL